MEMKNSLMSYLYLIAGMVLFLIVAGELVLRILVALFALKLINDGMRMRGMPSIQTIFRGWFFRMF